ncbi:alpha/beta hydrolase [Sphingomonas montana]|uniref:alpha/beta hydrolase n=1 Tax=Sphingomonas montana TaxID=1843236 RepID=UPI001F0B2168|nr:alpha/beta hydrolase [Sphingomonas montana]
MPFDRRAIPRGLLFDCWTAPDGRAMRRFHWAQPDGRPPRGRLLFQTGRADFAEKYLETIAHWHAAGWDVTGFDWRGQGGSRGDGDGDGTGTSARGIEAMLDDLRGFVRDWRRTDGVRHVAVGHSMGGHLLLRLLAERDVGIDRAVLVAPMLGLNSRPLPPMLAAGIARAAQRMGQGDRPLAHRRTAAIGRQGRLTGDADRYADETHWVGLHPAYRVVPPRWGWVAGAYRSIARLQAPGVLEGIAVPTLLVGTERDRLIDPRAIRAAAARMPAATLVMRTDGAHELLREVDAVRDAVLARIDAFLTEEDGG